MKWMLDTNACIRHLNGRAPAVTGRLNSLPAADIVVCSIVRAELFFGSARSSNPAASRRIEERFLALFRSLPFDDAAAEHYAQVRALLESRGTPIGSNDIMIAVIALNHGLTLVTNNVREFSRVPGLSFEDRESAAP